MATSSRIPLFLKLTLFNINSLQLILIYLLKRKIELLLPHKSLHKLAVHSGTHLIIIKNSLFKSTCLIFGV
jgi:hypothetical protein